jgi:SAM-dependent methyltransferase
MGDFGSPRPVSRHFGYDRGTPVDRFYIEDFLSAHARDLVGRALEVGASTYCERYGTGIEQQDVLHVSAGTGATVVGDLAAPTTLPDDSFDCMVLTQTLHLIYDLEAAVRHIHRALRAGGTVLATVPGVSSVDTGEWGGSWMWSLTEHSARRLFERSFGQGRVDVAIYGNVYAATCFLQGLAVEDVDPDRLRVRDPAYPVIVAVRARRA